MAIYLGNLTVKELGDKHSFTLSDEKAERTAKERGIEILPIDKYTQL